MQRKDTAVITDASWRTVYRVGAVSAIVAVAGSLFDIVLTMLPGWGTNTVPDTAAAWFAQFASQPLLGMRNLDLLNAVLSLVALPMYVAIAGACRRREPAMAATALAFVLAGAALFVASNAALPMLELSRRYAVAASEPERLALLGACEALLARGAHGSAGAFLGFFVSELGTLLMALAMLRGGAFSRLVGWIGAVGASVLAVYTTLMTFGTASATLVNAVAVPGGLLMVAWNVMVARTLLRLGAEEGSGGVAVETRRARAVA